MKIFQVVFLLDLDAISRHSTDEDIFNLKLKSLREVLLKLLTFFATAHCASDGDAAFGLKWGCKYYISSVNKSIRQRCTFKDFNLENYENFENELEDKLKNHNLELKAEHCDESSSRNSNFKSDVSHSQRDKLRSKEAASDQEGKSSLYKIRIANLELALRDLVCDYTWDQPYVCSPSRKTRRQQQNGEFRRKSNEDDTTGQVENIVIVITGIPRQHIELDGLVEGKRKLTQSVLLDQILPPSLYKQFVQISKIRIFWLDTSDVVQCDLNNEINSSEPRAIFELFHEALRKTGGGLIPINAILPSWHIGSKGSSACYNKHIPEGLAFEIPVASLMAGYLSGEPRNTAKQAQIRNYSHLQMHLGSGDSRPVSCNLELLPLFKTDVSYSQKCAPPTDKSQSFKISRTNKVVREKTDLKIDNLAQHFTATNAVSKRENDDCYIPRDICVIGTIFLNEIHRQLIANPLVYICFSVPQKMTVKQSNMDSPTLQQILLKLEASQMALLVSCDDFCQGIFFPSNSRCEVALLYVLASEGEASVFTLKVGSASIPKDINSFIKKSLDTYTNIPREKLIPKSNSKLEDAALSPAFLEKWFISHPYHKNALSEMKAASPPNALHIAQNTNFKKLQKTIFKKLQKAYLPSVMNIKLKESPSKDSIHCDQLRCSPRLKRDSQTKIIIPGRQLVPQSLNDQFCKNKKGVAGNDNSESDNNHLQVSRANLKKRTSILGKEVSKSGVCEQSNEIDTVTNLKAIYKNAISGDSAVLSIAQTVLDECLSFYKQQGRINAKMCTRDTISKHFLLKPGDIESSSNAKEVVKKWKIREHCFQSIIRLELLAIDSSKTEDYVSEITAHLRKLSFISGPSMLSSFLQETLVENYYGHLKEAVAEICEDLNQPLPYEDANFSPSSSNNELVSPVKSESIPTSLLSQMSSVSSISSSSNQSKSFKPKRSEVVTRHPSFGDIVHKRKIVISQIYPKRHSLHLTTNTGPLTRSAQKRAQEKLAGSKSAQRNVCRTLFKHGIPTTRKHTTPAKQHKPTTPKGRHVLRTKNVADTPVHKQVAQPMLRRQSLKRKRTLEIDSPVDEIVEESPDKQPNSSFNSRQSPKRHASTLRREASFYSGCPESKGEPTMANNVTTSKTPLRRSARKLAQMVCPEVTPDRKMKAKRVLILSDTPKKAMSATTPKKISKGNSSPFHLRRSDRLSGIEVYPPQTRTPAKSETTCTPTGSTRKSPRLSKCRIMDFKATVRNEADPLGKEDLTEQQACKMLKHPNVSRKLLQTPSKSDAKPASQTTSSSNSTTSDNDRVPSTPTRNGLDSPEASPFHTFLYGPLAGNLDDCMSRSSSPIISLLSNEMGDFYEDQNQFTSYEMSTDAAGSSKCDDFHNCPSADVNFSQYFSCNDTQTSIGSVQQDAIVPGEKILHEKTTCMFTPNKTFSTDIGSPECALPPWETHNDFSSAVGLLTKHTFDVQDLAPKKTGTLETIQISSEETINDASPTTSTTGEKTCLETKASSGSNNTYGLQRFTRQASKEIGISLKEFKKLTAEFNDFENSEEVDKTSKKKWKSTAEFYKEHHACVSPSRSKLSRTIMKSKFTSPNDKSLFHLTNSPILSSVSTRTTRYSLKK